MRTVKQPINTALKVNETEKKRCRVDCICSDDDSEDDEGRQFVYSCDVPKHNKCKRIKRSYYSPNQNWYSLKPHTCFCETPHGAYSKFQ